MADAKITVKAEDLASATLDAVKTRMQELGQAAQGSSANLSGFSTAASEAGASSSLLALGVGALGLAFTGAAVLSWGRDVLDAAGRLEDLTEKTDISVEGLQRF